MAQMWNLEGPKGPKGPKVETRGPLGPPKYNFSKCQPALSMPLSGIALERNKSVFSQKFRPALSMPLSDTGFKNPESGAFSKFQQVLSMPLSPPGLPYPGPGASLYPGPGAPYAQVQAPWAIRAPEMWGLGFLGL